LAGPRSGRIRKRLGFNKEPVMPGKNGVHLAADAKRASDAALEALQEARDALPELTRRAEKVLQDKAELLRTQSREAAAVAGEQLETARTYVVERVQERPFTTTLAVLGAGVLLGLLFAGRRR
jgi:ElaB/YqjD/DUF883 family membrane-anchored ribosome-binding protein